MSNSSIIDAGVPNHIQSLNASTQWVLQNIQPVTIEVQPMSFPYPVLPMMPGAGVTLGIPRSLKGFSFNESKYKFSRSNWYRAKYTWSNYNDVKSWCAENFGKQPVHPDAWSRWQTASWSGQILFRDEADYILYTLRWGG